MTKRKPKPVPMKPVKLWGLVDRSGNCAWSMLRHSLATVRAAKDNYGLDKYRIANVELREVTK